MLAKLNIKKNFEKHIVTAKYSGQGKDKYFVRSMIILVELVWLGVKLGVEIIYRFSDVWYNNLVTIVQIRFAGQLANVFIVLLATPRIWSKDKIKKSCRTLSRIEYE